MFQQDFLESFDLGLLAPDAGLTSNAAFMQHGEGGSVAHHQTLAERMQGDKRATLSSLNHGAKFDDLPTFGHCHDEWLESSSNLHEMMELAEVEEVKNEVVAADEDENDHQALIDEVEHFLHQHETSLPIQDSSDQDIFECPLTSSFIDEDDKLAAEQIIDQLFCSSIAIDLDDQEKNDFVLPDIDAAEVSTSDDVQEESGYVSKLNMSEMQMADGTKVFFVIAPESPTCDDSASQIGVESVLSEAMSGVMSPAPEIDSDESWSPASGCSSFKPRRKSSPQDKKGLRRTRQPVIDKKERKKIQNVEAARRYRDKKKSEQKLLDEELDELAEKNSELKSKVSEKENELKTLKKLMMELGLIKIAPKK